MPTAPRAPAVDKRALLRIQADLRRLNIIKTNQNKLVVQIQELVARYNKSETLASNVATGNNPIATPPTTTANARTAEAR